MVPIRIVDRQLTMISIQIQQLYFQLLSFSLQLKYLRERKYPHLRFHATTKKIIAFLNASKTSTLNEEDVSFLGILITAQTLMFARNTLKYLRF